MKTIRIIGLVLCAAGAFAANPEQVARVMDGTLKEARASWWGFDPQESTAALQAAIHSRVPRLIVDNMGAPWITDRLTGVSDQEIFFEPGTEVLAKKGAFTGKADALLTLAGVTNVTLRGPGATLRMRRADYDAPPYVRAEWCIRSRSRVAPTSRSSASHSPKAAVTASISVASGLPGPTAIS